MTAVDPFEFLLRLRLDELPVAVGDRVESEHGFWLPEEAEWAQGVMRDRRVVQVDGFAFRITGVQFQYPGATYAFEIQRALTAEATPA